MRTKSWGIEFGKNTLFFKKEGFNILLVTLKVNFNIMS